ncbi:MAG: response regulator [Proteobacteria bacterium]|nr:response regulator [Pseudomonadota bacterium]
MSDTAWQEVTLDRATCEIQLPPTGARLIALAGPHTGRVYSLQDGALIGRGSEALVRLEVPEISRRHALVTRRTSGRWVIEDLGSRNGTLVNGAPVSNEPHPLQFGDRVQIGSHALFVFTRYDQLEEQVLQSQRMEAVGRMAGGIAHDFNNLLAAITSTVEFLMQAAEQGPVEAPVLGECLGDIRQAARRAVELTSCMLDLSRRELGRPAAVDVSAVLHEVMQLSRRTFPGEITVEEAIAPGLFVMGQRAQIHQALMNVCVNARDAFSGREGGTINVSLSRVDASVPGGVPLLLAGRGSFILAKIADTGMGMDEDTAQRAFEPFFTTKGPDKGTGLGLSTVYAVVKNHGGHVEFDSQPGRGTIFRIYLPAVAERGPELGTLHETPQRTQRIAADLPAEKTILVVDDDANVRRGLVRLLEQLGYAVLAAGEGREALALFRQHQERIDLVLLDIVMPEVSGEQVFHQLRALRPALPIALMSGFAPQGSTQSMVHAGAEGFLHKPFERDALARLLNGIFGTQKVPTGPRPSQEG